jgi:hypothetical protein
MLRSLNWRIGKCYNYVPFVSAPPPPLQLAQLESLPALPLSYSFLCLCIRYMLSNLVTGGGHIL